MNTISVIMPVYNTADYVDRAILSVINQTYSVWELLIVDDGSTDSSLEICKNRAALDSRIRIFSKTNGGQGSARNLALEHCSGDYIMFLDSDDWIDEDTMQFLLGHMVNFQADVIECGCRSVSESGIVKPYQKKSTVIMNALECFDHLSKDDYVGPGACSKLFRRESVITKRFPEIRAYEDYQFIYDVCADIKKYVHIFEPKWNYFHRSNSTMTSSFSLRNLALIDAQKGICEILIQKGTASQFHEAQRILCSKQFYILSCLNSHPEIIGVEQAAANLKSDIMSSYSDYMQNPLMGKNKLMLWIFRYLPSDIACHLLKMKFGN